ncbi:MAG: amino acid permease [Acidobacteria bacterium]|nr:amino acid permease [Acidobacteriota bacterium]
MSSQLLRTKNIDQLIADTEAPERRLKKILGPWTLAALGVGAIIGTGIFVLTGTAAAGEKLAYESLLKAPLLDVLLHGSDALSVTGRPGAGPAIALSFLLVAIACALAGLCYAELASMIPVAGSAYTYSYATLGEIFAWIIGWDLILEYAVSNMAVGVGFSAHVDSLLQSFGIHLPRALITPAYTPAAGWAPHFNLPGFLIVLVLTVLLVIGIRESAGVNTVMVIIKVFAILLFVGAALPYIEPKNWEPVMPNGWQGVLTGGAIVFFTYIGFDSVSTAAEECRNPKRDVPFGILVSLAVCATLYITVAVVLTGIRPYTTFMGDAAPVVNALAAIGLPGVQRWVILGALMGMVSSLLVFQLGQTRVWFSMSRDGLLPKALSRVHQSFRTPHVSTVLAGVVVAIPAGILDIGTLADLSNIGTLFAFVLVAAGVMVLRRTQPERQRGFRVPGRLFRFPLFFILWWGVERLGGRAPDARRIRDFWVPVIPVSAIACCLVLMASLPVETWIRFLVWLVVGLGIYFLYSRKRSALNQSA